MVPFVDGCGCGMGKTEARPGGGGLSGRRLKKARQTNGLPSDDYTTGDRLGSGREGWFLKEMAGWTEAARPDPRRGLGTTGAGSGDGRWSEVQRRARDQMGAIVLPWLGRSATHLSWRTMLDESRNIFPVTRDSEQSWRNEVPIQRPFRASILGDWFPLRFLVQPTLAPKERARRSPDECAGAGPAPGRAARRRAHDRCCRPRGEAGTHG